VSRRKFSLLIVKLETVILAVYTTGIVSTAGFGFRRGLGAPQRTAWHAGICSRNGINQMDGVRMPGTGADFFVAAAFHNPAPVHHKDAVADMLYHGHIMGNKNIGDAKLLLELLE